MRNLTFWSRRLTVVSRKASSGTFDYGQDRMSPELAAGIRRVKGE